MLRLTTLHCSVFYFILFFAALIEANRVYELSDKFVEAYQKDTKAWLVKFYAPWCHHCKQMEPTYMQVAQKLHNEDIGVHVGRIDCTRFQAVASHFSVRGFPTLMFINKDKVVEYHGDRTEDEILDFARRAVGPKVRQIANCEALKTALDEHKVYFIYFGNEIPSDLVETIDEYHALNWFYQSKDVCPGYSEGLHVIKGPVNAEISHKFEKDVHSAQEWFRKHRFPQFVKITMGNFNYMLHSGKSLIIGVVEEYHSVGKLINKENEQFRAVLEDIAYTYDKQDAFVFGWSSQTDLLSSIALQPYPTLT
ncbi:Protein disulfide-isomerase TMX3 [Halotydeus destructor]|nr:Protein disulfide-isomerase TMX3 [Halotydeus destructor]